MSIGMLIAPGDGARHAQCMERRCRNCRSSRRSGGGSGSRGIRSHGHGRSRGCGRRGCGAARTGGVPGTDEKKRDSDLTRSRGRSSQELGVGEVSATRSKGHLFLDLRATDIHAMIVLGMAIPDGLDRPDTYRISDSPGMMRQTFYALRPSRDTVETSLCGLGRV